MASTPTPSETAAEQGAEASVRTHEVEPARRQLREPESEMPAVMRGTEAEDPELHRMGSSAHARRRAVGVDDVFEAQPQTLVRIRRPIEEHAPRERAPAPQRVVAPPLPPGFRRRRPAHERRPPSLVWAVVAGVAIAGLIVLVQRQVGPEPSPVARAKPEPAADMLRVRDPSTSAATTATAPDASSAAVRTGPTAVPPEAADPVAVPAPVDEPMPSTPAATRQEPPAKRAEPRPPANPRTPPPGTPTDVAAIFAKLPVSPADLPPVGGIGRSGIHVDRIEMGSTYDKGLCGGTPDKFSLAKLERVNVCLRVVHPREEEVVSVVWEKHDLGTARRGKIAIKPLHAYRTRAYLVLRKEYVGDWTVRILSAEGIELAAHDFSIVP